MRREQLWPDPLSRLIITPQLGTIAVLEWPQSYGFPLSCASTPRDADGEPLRLSLLQSAALTMPANDTPTRAAASSPSAADDPGTQTRCRR